MKANQSKYEDACDDLATSLESMNRALAFLTGRDVGELTRADGTLLYISHRLREARARLARLREAIPPPGTKGSNAA